MSKKQTKRLGKNPLAAPHPSPNDKCSRKYCSESRLPPTLWCRDHQTCGTSVACDNLPALAR
jgi:hypothetical protein